MDLFKLTSGSAHPTEWTMGEAINGYLSALWVEKFQEPGEFKLESRLSSGLKELLPIGSFISHVRTREVMRVENHEIEEAKDEDPMISITGRSFVAYLEERIVGQNVVAAGGDAVVPYLLVGDDTWEQIVNLISDHFVNGFTDDFEDCVVGVTATHSCVGSSDPIDRNVKFGTIWQRVSELLKVDDIGIRMLRPVPGDTGSEWNVYQGVDRSDTVRFSTIMGDLDNVEYLFSEKKYKNRIRVYGRWVQIATSIIIGPENVDRRYMVLEASDIDGQYTAMPTGTDLTDVKNAMIARGRDALRKQQNITITQADISPNSRLQYGIDYFLGDLVMVDANFNESQVMRVSEFAESEDENGTSGHPTLEIPGEN